MDMLRDKLLMDFDWKFHNGDIETKPIHPLLIGVTHYACKSERGRGPAAAVYNDTGWETVNLPHDYVIEGKPDQSVNSAHGSLKRNNAWYRKTFRLEHEDHDRRVLLVFDGVSTHCTVWINGHLMTRHFGGYEGFEVDFTDVANYGDELNTVSVFVDTSEFEGWWYEGGGIYRHVWMYKTNRVSVDFLGTWVNPIKVDERKWKVEIETILRNDEYKVKAATIISQIKNSQGCVVGSAQTDVILSQRYKARLLQSIEITNPILWSLEDPCLYCLRTSVFSDGIMIDEYDTTFGFRTIAFDSENGFFLNGKSVKLKGVCAHEDHGGLGVALPDSVKEFRIKRLKSMGANAYRTSHNLPSNELLDICDRLGMLVMDENRWFESYGEGLEQLKYMVRRDRNHPSIIFWSVSNEEPLQGSEKGWRIMNSMRSCVKQLDGTRPVTLPMHTGLMNKCAAVATDVVGMNYNMNLLEQVHALYPDKPIVGSEMYSVSNDPEGDRQMGKDTWRMIDNTPYMMGLFIWTGIDYRGEHRYPTLFAPSGALDLNCNPRDDYYIYQAYWTTEPMVRISTHWNWEGKEGQKIDISVYTNQPTAELVLNGRSLGEKTVDPYDHVQWSVEYESGELVALAKKDGIIAAEHKVRTAGEPVALKLCLENDIVRSDGEDVAIINVYAVDVNGIEVPTACETVEFETNGYGRFIAAANSDISDHDAWTEPRRKLFNGTCQIVVKASDQEGILIVHARSPRLGEATIDIKLQSCSRRPYVISEIPRNLYGWRMSQVSNKAYDMDTVIRENKVSAWEPIDVGHGFQIAFTDLNAAASVVYKKAFAIYHLEVDIPEFKRRNGKLAIVFEEIVGKALVMVNAVDEDSTSDSVVGAEKTQYEDGRLAVNISKFKPGQKIAVWVMLEANTTYCGITRPVIWDIS